MSGVLLGAAGGRARRAGVVVGLFAAFAFATSGPVVKPLLAAGWSPGAALLVRLSVGTLLLAAPACFALRGRWGTVRREWRTVLGFGGLGVATTAGMYFLAVERLPIAVALLVEYTSPVLLVLWRWARSRRMPSRATLAGAALATGGLVLVLDLTGSVRLDPLGLAFAVAAAVGNAGYFVFAARPTELPAVGLAGVGMGVGALVTAFAALVGVLPLAASTAPVELLGARVPWAVPLVVVAVVPTAIAYGVSAISVRLLGERVASFLALSEVLFAVVLAWVLLAEAPVPVQLAGAALVVAGVAAVRRGADEDAARGREPRADEPIGDAGAPAAVAVSAGGESEGSGDVARW